MSKANNSGLIIALIVNKKRILLTGDCEYTMLPKELYFSKTRYNYLMVPHHCSKMHYLPLCTTSHDTPDYAIISAGDNHYKCRHPYLKHIEFLKKGKYNITKTLGNWYIEINLNKCSCNNIIN